MEGSYGMFNPATDAKEEGGPQKPQRRMPGRGVLDGIRQDVKARPAPAVLPRAVRLLPPALSGVPCKAQGCPGRSALTHADTAAAPLAQAAKEAGESYDPRGAGAAWT